ncbi:hypothetical protein ULMS_05000 [Patiriisocius marinistellae]|uniref:Uncharacterized protein n=1 Tax=Patiriisocius marinistellae TaxID=2494560 RepID=A0A5J4FVA8_9FLAO|nr:tetratricopeptide repeat protein [Patiriisocius marinistellae]GEQ84992.1 hypothetical protein ULMS_05000 [Patiriisocius marinistellae]
MNRKKTHIIENNNFKSEVLISDFFQLKAKISIGLILLLFVIFPQDIIAQETEKEKEQRAIERSNEYLSEASQLISADKFVRGEGEYRRAISANQKQTTGNYNLGNSYYLKSKNGEAKDRFKKAAKNATTKPERHRAFHNLGNAMMNEKDYAGAVDAYKNALRNNPTDDESRYNLALAKDMLEKNPPQGGGGDDNKDNQDQQDENKEDKKDQENEDKKEGDDGEDKENEDKGDEEDKDKEGDKEDDKGKPDEPKDPKDEPKDPKDEQGEQPQQPVPGKLSPQEVKNLLESMNNEEKKVQDKINAQKQKGAKVKSEKDW